MDRSLSAVREAVFSSVHDFAMQQTADVSHDRILAAARMTSIYRSRSKWQYHFPGRPREQSRLAATLAANEGG
jgi:hypothetical protein